MKTVSGALSGEGWKLFVALGALLLVVLAMSHGSRFSLGVDLHRLTTDPTGTLDDLAIRGGGVALLAGGILHFTPWTRTHGAAMVDGVLKGLAVVFIGVPLVLWVVGNRGLVWSTLSSLAGGG